MSVMLYQSRSGVSLRLLASTVSSKRGMATTATSVEQKAKEAAKAAANAVQNPSYRAPTPPTGIPLSKIFSNTFPLSYSKSYQQWRTSNLELAEKSVLSLLPFYPLSDGIRKAQSLNVDIGGGLHINEFEISPVKDKVENDLVVMHGYGAGLAFFYKNLGTISSLPGWRTHALDLLGYGRSSRPKFKVRARGLREGILEAEDFFIDALEKWRIAKGLERFTLVAHSLGAYLGASYAKKYPGRVKKLMLVSPAGVPRSEYSINADGTKPKPLRTKSKTPLWFHYLWESHVSPFSLVRNTGPLGPYFVSGWTSRRFANLPLAESEALHLYAYNIFNAVGSGEYALNYLLAPGAHGRRPLGERAAEIPCDTTWVYGAQDWMDVNGGHEACDLINASGKHQANLIKVSNSGHHIYLDNPTEFNSRVLDFLKS